ncbi:MAG TPA: hypothetical protein VJR27_05940 [Candidatus Saccharimonadales bacterium]|nr:hypothetical protein [Candidatus Saccharimonadales bacterium]
MKIHTKPSVLALRGELVADPDHEADQQKRQELQRQHADHRYADEYQKWHT